MRITFLLLLVPFLLPKPIAAQSKHQEQTAAGLNYWANDDVDVIGSVEEYLGPGGEVFVATRNGFRMKVQKLSNQLEVVKSLDINVFDIEGALNTHEPEKRMLYMIGNVFCLVSETSGLADQEHHVQRQIRFYNQNLDPVSEWELLSKNRAPGHNPFIYYYGIKAIMQSSESYGVKAYKKLQVIGNTHYNETGLISVTTDLNRDWSFQDPIVYHMTRFDSMGQKVYAKDVTFSQARETFFLADLVLMEDGSMLYFFQQDGMPAYRIITKEGDELEGEELDFSESEFMLTEVIRNPLDPDCFVMIGFDENYHLSVYYYSMLGFKNGENRLEVSFDKIANLVLDDWALDIYENKLYIAAVSGSSNYTGALFDNVQTILAAACIDLSQLSLPAKEVLAPASAIIPDRFLTWEQMPNVWSILDGAKGFEEGVLLAVKTYTVIPNQGVYHATISPSGMVFDFENHSIRFKEKYAIIIPDIEMKNGKPLYYTFSKETEKPNKKMLAFRVLDYSGLTEADSAEAIHYIPEKMLYTATVKNLGIYNDDTGKRFIYMKISSGHLYLKLPLTDQEDK